MSPKAKGHSKQREVLLHYLMRCKDHPTAGHIAEEMARLYGPVSTSNLYRNLEILVASGEVSRLKLDEGPDRFDANTTPHYHVACTNCQRVSDMPIREGDRFDLPLPLGFRASSWEITVRGLCASCAKASHPFHHKEV
jgi:Fur family peroxide stress response transcriptional regulator